MKRSICFFLAALLIGFATACTKLPPNPPTEVVRLYVEVTNKGNQTLAWELIHPNCRLPLTQQRFLATMPPKNPQQIKSVRELRILETWEDALKRNNLPDGQTWKDAAEVQIEWEDGQTQVVHLSKDQEGRWRLIWSPQFALE
jgi:hypothetical protein